jgi:anti-sigma-K factor RskA
MTGALPAERQAMAAELALGVLQGEELRAAAELERTDAGFAAEAAFWRERLAAFDRSAPEAALPTELWSRIETRLAGAAQEPVAEPALETSRAREMYEQGRLPLSSREAAGEARRKLFGWLWDSLNVWRIGAGLAVAAALFIAVGLNRQLQEARSAPVLVAILTTDANQPAAVVNAFADGRTELVPLTTFTVPAGRVLEVWTLWDRQVGPRSIGLLAGMATSGLNLRDFPRGEGQLFEITLEPAGGSPIGRPTGPVLAIGRAARSL